MNRRALLLALGVDVSDVVLPESGPAPRLTSALDPLKGLEIVDISMAADCFDVEVTSLSDIGPRYVRRGPLGQRMTIVARTTMVELQDAAVDVFKSGNEGC